MKEKRILVGCEESQVMCKAFRDEGFEAYSCDLLPTRGNPDWHYHRDVLTVIPEHRWGLIILHPDCTALCCSGNRWYGNGMPLNGERHLAVQWTVNLWKVACEYSDRVALENPKGVLWKHLPNRHYIHPWQHGHGETKETGFCVKGLPEITPTNIVEGRENRIHRMPPSDTRKRDRSETYAGIAMAIVKQWGRLL